MKKLQSITVYSTDDFLIVMRPDCYSLHRRDEIFTEVGEYAEFRTAYNALIEKSEVSK